MGRLMNSRAYTENKGKTLKEVDLEIFDLQFKSGQSKTMQGMMYILL